MKNKFGLISISSLVILLVVAFFANYILDKDITINVDANNYLDATNTTTSFLTYNYKIIDIGELECSIKLDVNEDGKITRNDTSYLDNLLFGKNPVDNGLEYDFDKDETLSSKDILYFDGCIIKQIFKINNENIYFTSYNSYDGDISFTKKLTLLNFILGIPANLKVSEFKEIIETDNTVSILNSKNEIILDTEYVKTGDKLRIDDSSGQYSDFTLIVTGDVLQTGVLDISNAKRIASYVVNRRWCSYSVGKDGSVYCYDDYHIPEGSDIDEEGAFMFSIAADYNGDGSIRMDDVMMMLKEIENKEE